MNSAVRHLTLVPYPYSCDYRAGETRQDNVILLEIWGSRLVRADCMRTLREEAAKHNIIVDEMAA